MADVAERCLDAFEWGQKEEALRLLPKVHQPQNVKSSHGFTFIHWAAFRGWHDVCQILVEKYHLNPADKNDDEYTPLHFACMEYEAQVMEYLLSLPTVLLAVNDEDIEGQTALDWACSCPYLPMIEKLVREPSVHMPTEHLPSHNFGVLSLFSSRMEWDTEFPIRPSFRVFMAGNSAAGKTTLTTVMVKLTEFLYTSPRLDDLVTEVKTLTAGVCPTPCSG